MFDKQKINDASWALTASVRDTSQSIADTLVGMQEHNMRYAQSVYDNGMEVLNISWMVVVRTCIFDELILQLLEQEEVETVLSLGADLHALAPAAGGSRTSFPR
jgi:O-methyltransferase involved in polyketide biosynthesis